jgi:hypothetical protein
MSRKKRSSPETTHSAVVAAGTGTALGAQGMSKATVQIVATNISAGGGVFALEGSDEGPSYGVLTSKTTASAGLAVTNRLFTVSANGTYILEYVDLSLFSVRVNFSTRTDGTYTIKVFMSE